MYLFLFILPLLNFVKCDELYIMIDQISVYNCRGVKNEIKLVEDDVEVVNEKGNKVYYIRAPGNYSLHFRNIGVNKQFGYLAGEIGVTLQVPVIEGPAGIRFDLPYTMIPESGLLNSKCDDNSGIIERNGRQFCRYCDLCTLGKQVENDLNAGQHQFLPSTNEQNDAKGSTCGNINADTYDFKRTISLPDRTALENMIKGKVQGIDEEVKKRLNKGRGRFQVFLNLISAEKPAQSQSQWFSGSRDCRCCTSTPDASCDSLSYLYCNIEDCKSGWALQCLHKSAKIVACYSVEFNYRMTTSYADVLKFLRENNYPNQDRANASQLSAVANSAAPQTVQPVPVEASEKSVPEQCVAIMANRLTHLKRYCTIFWNAKLCCAHCSGVC